MLGGTGTLTVVLLSILLAGCSAKPPTEPVSKPLESMGPPVDDTTLLRVLVITDEYLPIDGANVIIVGLGLNATTDAVGNAYFQIGDPGRYAVHVHRPGFYPNISKVTVEGDPRQVERITLLDSPRDAHFSDFRYFEGVCEPTFFLQPVPTSPRCQEQGIARRAHPPGWFLGPGLVGGYVRLDWDPQTYGTQRMRLEVAFPEAGAFANGEETLVAEGAAPVVIELQRELLTPAMRRNGIPAEVHVGVPGDDLVATNIYQVFAVEAQFDYFQEAPDVDNH